MIELGLHLALRISTAKRLQQTKVRLEMFDIMLAERLLDMITIEVGKCQKKLSLQTNK